QAMKCMQTPRSKKSGADRWPETVTRWRKLDDDSKELKGRESRSRDDKHLNLLCVVVGDR
ncbi:hypothetical protein KI387_043159, partial [Taxus chinensis]